MATAPLISIQNVKSSQIPPDSTAPIPLKSGTLTLTEPLAGTPTEAKLFLTITPLPTSVDTTPLTIPLHPDHFLGSKSGLCQTFRFKLPSVENLGAIEVEFPEDVAEEDALSFEKVLVYNGFLKTGLVAEADDLSKKITETAASVASYLSRKTDERNEKTPPTEEDHEFSDITKDIVGTTEQGTTKVVEATEGIGKIVSDAVYNAGAWIGSKTGVKGNSTDEPSSDEPKSLARETLDQTLEAGAIAGRGIGHGVTTVGSEIGESASKMAEHDHGSEAKELVDSTRQSGANLGYAAKDVFVGTSVVINAGKAGVGATKTEIA
ncbi:hypothetical protein ABW19_dt0209433 [Dactylella cylindrospora]|nr:hypothetical protein ABW19_dt0209433 [Dactylella cylindrospora]